MGWSGGSSLLSGVWAWTRKFVPEDKRVEVLGGLMVLFADQDCDTLGELICPEWPEALAAYLILYPDEEL
jgi:hypothetical protein